MSNNWFQFRQFKVCQDQSAMKVGTDGVLLGAWAAGSRQAAVGSGAMLDIGTGTGLIALMLAQRFPYARITALEIDEAAASQAKENAEASAWADRIEVVQADFRIWTPLSDGKFDLIVCNPPFFSRSLKNPDGQKAAARHDDDLMLSDIIPKSAGLLSPAGKLAIILPVGRADEALILATGSGLFLTRRLEVRGTANASSKRVLMEWGREKVIVENEQLVIETGVRGRFSEEYRRLTGEFYPYFRGNDKSSHGLSL